MSHRGANLCDKLGAGNTAGDSAFTLRVLEMPTVAVCLTYCKSRISDSRQDLGDPTIMQNIAIKGIIQQKTIRRGRCRASHRCEGYIWVTA